MDNIKIYNFRSETKNNPLAPEWNYIMAESQINDVDFKNLSKFILKKEKELISKYKLPNKIYSDGYTGLGKNSLTSRFTEYNFIDLKNKEIIKLKKNIINFHNKLLELLKIENPKNLWIRCWANVMRKGEQIKTHVHGVSSDTYLGGHICVQCEDTSTHYINPINTFNNPNIFSSKNEVGKFTLFQNFIPHYTDVYKGEKERITIAFDLMTNEQVYTSPLGNKYKFIKLF